MNSILGEVEKGTALKVRASTAPTTEPRPRASRVISHRLANSGCLRAAKRSPFCRTSHPEPGSHLGMTRSQHVEVNDKAAPMIDPEVKIKENPFKQVASDLTQPHELKHVEEIKDKSAPFIDPEVQIKENGHNNLMSEIVRRASTEVASN